LTLAENGIIIADVMETISKDQAKNDKKNKQKHNKFTIKRNQEE